MFGPKKMKNADFAALFGQIVENFNAGKDLSTSLGKEIEVRIADLAIYFGTHDTDVGFRMNMKKPVITLKKLNDNTLLLRADAHKEANYVTVSIKKHKIEHVHGVQFKVTSSAGDHTTLWF
jgi:hypothetical protein